jgi:hypothetical protein
MSRIGIARLQACPSSPHFSKHPDVQFAKWDAGEINLGEEVSDPMVFRGADLRMPIAANPDGIYGFTRHHWAALLRPCRRGHHWATLLRSSGRGRLLRRGLIGDGNHLECLHRVQVDYEHQKESKSDNS